MEQITCSDHPRSQLAGLTTPTDTRYRPGNVVIIGSHCDREKRPSQYRCACGRWKISSMYGSRRARLKAEKSRQDTRKVQLKAAEK